MSLRLVIFGGAGRIAADYLAVLEHSDDFEIVGLVDPDPTAPERAGDRLHSDPDELLRNGDVDAALVLTPPTTHAEISIAAMRAGCHVLCEKPLATTTDDAERMLAAATEHGRVLMMASKFRFVDDVARAREIVAGGEIGSVAFYQNAFCAKVDMRQRWNSDPQIAGGGVLIDNGTHSVDIARFLIGPIARVSATFGPRVQPLEVEDSAMLLFESTQRTVGRIELSWSVDRPSEHYIEMHGALGTLQVGWRGSRYRTGGEWIEFGNGYDKRHAFGAQLAHFAAVARGDAATILDAEDALASVRLVEAAYRAAARGTWETVRALQDTR